MTRALRARSLHVLLAVLCLSAHPNGADPQSDELTRQSPEQLLDSIERKHPTTYYVLASKLFADDQRDEAVFWFYVGQLRYRFHLEADPSLDPSVDPALFASLSESVGRPLNEYAFGHVPTLLGAVDRALAWDEEHDNGFTSKTEYAAALDTTRAGLKDFREFLVNNQEDIKRQRTANGLTNR